MNSGRWKLNAPEPAPPFRFNRNRQLRKIAPFSVDQVVHAFQTALIVFPVGVIDKARNHELLLKIVGIEFANLLKNFLERDVILGKRLGLGLEPVSHHRPDFVT